MRNHPITTLILMALFMSAIPLSSANEARAIEQSDAAPAFLLDSSDGAKIGLDRFKGKVVYLDFFASWCGPCQSSFPFMNQLEQKYGDKGFAVVAINLDKNPSDAKKFLDAKHPNFTVLFDPESKIAEAANLDTMPTSMIIDRSGKVALIHRGFKKSDREEIAQAIEKLLN